jgi:hypothetical protein
VLTFWATLGPRAGLYTVFYHVIPVFSFLRAPERMGIVVMLCLALLAAFTVRAIAARWPARRLGIGAAIAIAVLVELNDVPYNWREDAMPPAAYRVLADMPRGALVAFPFPGRRIDFHLHTRAMLNSTVHWQPLVNGYSDHIPADFRESAPVLATFPSDHAFLDMKARRVRYIAINVGRAGYGSVNAAVVMQRLEPYMKHLKPLADDGEVKVYEVVSWPR